MLPKLAAALNTTVDALLGYNSVVTDYDKRYNIEEYYWGLMPNRICYDIMKILPPIKPYRVLDIGCGEGKDAVFFAKCGYVVTAFDISKQGMKKKDTRGVQESYSDIIMTGCSIPVGKKYLTATAEVHLISIVWIRLLHKKRKEAVKHMVYAQKACAIIKI